MLQNSNKNTNNDITETSTKEEGYKMKNENQSLINDLTEGKLYRLEDGELIELIIDKDDLRKVKITDDAIKHATKVQKEMRAVLNGYKPDITTVCSALIKAQSDMSAAKKSVAAYWLEKAQQAVGEV